MTIYSAFSRKITTGESGHKTYKSFIII